MDPQEGFFWERHPEAERAVLDLIDECRNKNASLADFEKRLLDQSSARLLDCIDHLIISDTRQSRAELDRLGFISQPGQDIFHHPGALLPRIILDPKQSMGIALRVECISDFMQINGFRSEIEGVPLSHFRRALINKGSGASWFVVERRGTSGVELSDPDIGFQTRYLEAVESWQKRPRHGEDEKQIFDEISAAAGRIKDRLGEGLSSHIICGCERNYWLSKNLAGRMQQARQDALGLGWPNHDHYTFRSSRRNFFRLVTLFSRLGFENRERYYAGEEAGWGAQIMENPASGITLFLDVDLKPEETNIDFSREHLEDTDRLGTVGLWCELHGDSILAGGLHHFAARFDFEKLAIDLSGFGIGYMAPFSNFPYLKQSFSVAERWQVDPVRVKRLLAFKALTNEQADRFLSQGAVGSHLENIERSEGYKGFNRKNVSAIIRETDPRK